MPSSQEMEQVYSTAPDPHGGQSHQTIMSLHIFSSNQIHICITHVQQTTYFLNYSRSYFHSKWVSEYGFMSGSTRYTSYQGQVFAGNHLHWYWQWRPRAKYQTNSHRKPIPILRQNISKQNIQNISSTTISKNLIQVLLTPSGQEMAFSTRMGSQSHKCFILHTSKPAVPPVMARIFCFGILQHVLLLQTCASGTCSANCLLTYLLTYFHTKQSS